MRGIESGFKGSLYVEDPILLSDLSARLHGLLREFSAGNPGLTAGLRTDERLTTAESIDRGVFDVGQAMYREKDLDGVEVDGRLYSLVSFMEEEVVLWVDKAHPLASKPDLRFSDPAGCEVAFPGAPIWQKWRSMPEGMAREYGFAPKSALTVSEMVGDCWSEGCSGPLSLHSSQVAGEKRIADRESMVIRRFELDDTSFMFYLVFDAHSKSPSVALFEDYVLQG